MHEIDIQLTTSPGEADLKTISRGIETYNEEFLPNEVVYEKDTKFAVFARDENGNVVGGVRATAFWNYCIIELLWLSSEARGKRAGTRLMEAAENHARDVGFEYVRTETLDFQAKPFYERLGYRVFGELSDYPKGHTTYCLVKELSARQQGLGAVQGLAQAERMGVTDADGPARSFGDDP